MEIIVSFLVGTIVGALVARNNIKKLNALVEEAKELADKAEVELKELKADLSKKKKPARKPKTPTKKK
tara:strand:+ start:49 stop:252 length:204 start_codon:yes stop_codon:yes gene_type:complete